MAQNNDPEKIASEGIEKELRTLDLVLSTRVNRSVITLDEYIKLRFMQGASLDLIREELLRDLEEGGRIFGELKRALQPTFSGSINRFRDIGIVSEVGVITKWRWVAVLINTCEDCLDRHTNWEPQTWVEWEEDGLPRSGATVCREYCKCVLIPEKIARMEPIYREK